MSSYLSLGPSTLADGNVHTYRPKAWNQGSTRIAVLPRPARDQSHRAETFFSSPRTRNGLFIITLFLPMAMYLYFIQLRSPYKQATFILLISFQALVPLQRN